MPSNKLRVEAHWIEGASQCRSPNYSARYQNEEPSLIVIHNISLPPNEYGGPWITDLFLNRLDPKAHPYFAEINHLKVASHLLIQRTGEVIQYVPFDQKAFHAGVSNYLGRDNCNEFSIGIELEGSDDDPFTEVQYQALKRVVECLCEHYSSLSFGHITGHEHIAPGRKTDPGPYFDWQRLSQWWGEALPAGE